MSKVDHALVDTLTEQFAQYLVTAIHDFVSNRKEDPGVLLPDYRELLTRLGTLSARAVIAYVINPLLASGTFDEAALERHIEGMYADLGSEEIQGLATEEAQLRRVQYLLEALPDRQARFGQLYPEDLEELDALLAHAKGASPAELRALLVPLENLWVLAQDGVRVFRGDADWLAALQRNLDDAVVRMHGEDLENHLIQKALLTLEGTAEIRGKARDVLSQQLDAAQASREELESQLASLAVQEKALREKRRALL